MFFCIPIIFGCPTKVKQDPPEAGRMCPRCNNAAVVGASSRTWFELCWIPLIPFKKKHIWICTLCQWEMRKGDGYDPVAPGTYDMAPQNNFANHAPPPPNYPPKDQIPPKNQYPPKN